MNKNISLREIVEELHITSKTAQLDLDELKSKNKIQRTDAAKGSFWEVI